MTQKNQNLDKIKDAPEITGLDLLKQSIKASPKSESKNIKWSALSEQQYNVIAEYLNCKSFSNKNERESARKSLLDFINKNEANVKILNTFISFAFGEQRPAIYHFLVKNKKFQLLKDIEAINK